MTYISAFPAASTTIDAGPNNSTWNAGSTRIMADDGVGVSCTWDSSNKDHTDFLRAKFSFSIPVNSTVQGFELDIDRQVSTTNLDLHDLTVQLVRGSTRVGNNYATTEHLPAGFGVATYGGSNDLWGTTWAPSDVNSTDFGADLQLVAATSFPVSNAQVDYFAMRVHWQNGGTSFITFSPTATITASASIAGTGTITFSPSGILSGTAELGGSTTITFTPSATIVAAAAISGSATVTFTPSGTLLGTGALAGATTITFTGTGVLVEQGKLSGSASITFTPTATIEAQAAIAGSATITFDATGLLVAEGALAGNTTVIFSPSATLVADGALAGTGTITFSARGMFAVEPEKPLRYTRYPRLLLPGSQQPNLR